MRNTIRVGDMVKTYINFKLLVSEVLDVDGDILTINAQNDEGYFITVPVIDVKKVYTGSSNNGSPAEIMH